MFKGAVFFRAWCIICSNTTVRRIAWRPTTPTPNTLSATK